MTKPIAVFDEVLRNLRDAKTPEQMETAADGLDRVTGILLGKDDSDEVSAAIQEIQLASETLARNSYTPSALEAAIPSLRKARDNLHHID